MIFDWYKIASKTEFEALGLVSKAYEVFLDGIGTKTVLLTKGSGIGVRFEDVFLMLELNNRNPFSFDGYACYLDQDDNIWLGVQVED